MGLWEQDDCAAWAMALGRYPAVVEAQGVAGLGEVDSWYRTALPALMGERSPPAITAAELEQVTRWKMKRGVWRERNRILVAGNDPATVSGTSADAFAAVPDLRRPIAVLTALAGVGPATASAVLAAYRPDLYPFFDEVVARQIPGLGAVAFTPGYYARYADALRERAARLDAGCRAAGWAAHDLGQALWAVAGGKAGRA